MGEETYYIDEITNYIVDNVLTEEEKGFNQTIFYGKDVDAATVVMAARRLSNDGSTPGYCSKRSSIFR